ncbi:ribonuclease H-like domain-containing protein [Tanacetum coccineum]
MHDPRQPHLAALKRILRYVYGSLDLGLHLYASSTTSLVSCTDADWVGCPSTCRSTSSYCVFLGDNLLSWSAKRQHTLSRSSAEVEYQGVANLMAETAWLCNLLFVLVGDGVEAIKDMVEDESHLIMYLIGDHLCALKMLIKVFVADRNRGRGGSISMISGRGGGWFAIHLMDSNDGSSGGLVVLDGKCSKESIKVGGDGGVVSSGVVLGVVSSSVREMLFGAKGVVGGDSRSMDGGATL